MLYTWVSLFFVLPVPYCVCLLFIVFLFLHHTYLMPSFPVFASLRHQNDMIEWEKELKDLSDKEERKRKAMEDTTAKEASPEQKLVEEAMAVSREKLMEEAKEEERPELTVAKLEEQLESEREEVLEVVEDLSVLVGESALEEQREKFHRLKEEHTGDMEGLKLSAEELLEEVEDELASMAYAETNKEVKAEEAPKPEPATEKVKTTKEAVAAAVDEAKAVAEKKEAEPVAVKEEAKKKEEEEEEEEDEWAEDIREDENYSERAHTALSSRLDSMISRIEKRIEVYDVQIGDKLRILDQDQDGILSDEEVRQAIKVVLKEYNTDEEVNEVMQRLLVEVQSKDGRISVEQLKQLAEAYRKAQQDSEDA